MARLRHSASQNSEELYTTEVPKHNNYSLCGLFCRQWSQYDTTRLKNLKEHFTVANPDYVALAQPSDVIQGKALEANANQPSDDKGHVIQGQVVKAEENMSQRKEDNDTDMTDVELKLQAQTMLQMQQGSSDASVEQKPIQKPIRRGANNSSCILHPRCKLVFLLKGLMDFSQVCISENRMYWMCVYWHLIHILVPLQPLDTKQSNFDSNSGNETHNNLLKRCAASKLKTCFVFICSTFLYKRRATTIRGAQW